MLQQTQVATVLRYYSEWMRRFPTLRALATAPESEVLHAWQGLGYYSRARRLKRGAEVVVERHGGKVPRDHAALLALPGVGDYSAGAIASIAFGERRPLVDGNVVRVLTRVFGLRGDPAKLPLRRKLWELAGELVPSERPGDFNQALMELGATVCTPRAPRCDACPLARRCEARRLRLTDVLPELPARVRPTRVRVAAAIVRERGRVLVVQQPADAARWAGLWTFPHAELAVAEPAEEAARRAALEQGGHSVRVGKALTRLEHTITRFRISIDVFEATLARGSRAPERASKARGVFVPTDALEAHAMPAPHRKLARKLFG